MRTLVFYPLEFVMTPKHQRPVSPPLSGHPPTPTRNPQLPPTEPVEVLGRHKNTGQKDHKGAR